MTLLGLVISERSGWRHLRLQGQQIQLCPLT